MTEVTEVTMPDFTSPELRNLKSHIYQGIKAVKDNLLVQPWLNPTESHLRDNTQARKYGARIGIDGRIRTLSISDLGAGLQCPRQLAASYAGIAVQPLPGMDRLVYRGKSGSQFHDAVEHVLPSAFVTSWSEKQQVQDGPRPVDRTKVWLPGLGTRTSRDYAGKEGISGRIDGYIEPADSGFELKSIPPGEEMPDSVSLRYIGQAAGYQRALLRKPPKASDGRGFWSPKFWTWVFLPQNVRDLKPEDASTYRVFIATKEQLLAAEKQVEEQLKTVSQLVDQWGVMDAVRKIPACVRPDCNICANPQPFVGVTQRF